MTKHTVSAENARKRLDVYSTEVLAGPSRSYVASLINSKKILVNGSSAQSSYKIKLDDRITIDFEPESREAPYDLDIPIIFENDDVMVLNKPTGVLTHSKGAYNPEETVSTFVQKRLGSAKLGSDREWIVHRLDRATSGVIICAKNEKALASLQLQFAKRKAEKIYLAVINGRLENDEAIIDMPIDRNQKDPKRFMVTAQGKQAITRYKLVEYSHEQDKSFLNLFPKTGRTHQLRVHLAQLKHPIIGDIFYNGTDYERLMLHAQSLEIMLPTGEMKKFVAPIPESFNNCMHGK